MNNRIGKMSELAWFLGLSLCALGVCFAAKSGFGVSMIVAPAYVLHLKISQFYPWFSFGVAEYIWQGLILILLSFFMKRFKIKYVLGYVSVIFYGFCLDFFRFIFGTEVYDAMSSRLISGAAGILISSFAIAIVLRTYLPQEAYEILVSDITKKTGENMTKVKWIFDIASLMTAIILMLILFRKFSFEIIGLNTLICTVVNAPIIGFFGKRLDKKFDFTPAFQKLSDFVENYLE